MHALVAAFIVFGLALVYLGKLRHWYWVRDPWFRSAHLLAIAVVVLQSWVGSICPLTTWEMRLRLQAGEPVYDGSFVAHWLHRLLFYEAPPWVFVVAYSLFGGLVLLSWWLVRPRAFASRRRSD